MRRGLSLRAVARLLNVHPTAVSQTVSPSQVAVIDRDTGEVLDRDPLRKIDLPVGVALPRLAGELHQWLALDDHPELSTAASKGRSLVSRRSALTT